MLKTLFRFKYLLRTEHDKKFANIKKYLLQVNLKGVKKDKKKRCRRTSLRSCYVEEGKENLGTNRTSNDHVNQQAAGGL